ncbi:MAG: hypothetical protein WCY59_07770 [Anaerovoracaceae bacterium]
MLYFGGGWTSYDWLDLAGRMQVVEFVENRGGGVIFSMFRCGWSRSGIRPIFPEVAEAYNKANGPGIVVVDTNHPIARNLPEKFMTPYFDHTVMRLGAEGKILAVDNNNDITIACGAVGKGRVVFIGPWIGLDKEGKPSYPLPSNDAKLLLNSIDWLTANPCRQADGSHEVAEKVKLKVLRRDMVLNWTHNARGTSFYVGILTAAMYALEEKKTAWEITPYYTRCYSKHRVFMRGPKPAELADIARITARQWRQYETRLKLSNPVLTGLRFLQVFENKSVRTYAQAAEILGVSRERVYQMTALVTKLPAEIRDFLAGANDHAVLQHFTERRLRPLTIMPTDEEKIERFREMLAEVEYSA